MKQERYDMQPCDHIPVYKRIKIGSDYHSGPPVPTSIPQPVYAEQQARLAEGERIWAITRQTAMGTNAPTVAPIAPEPCADTAPSEITAVDTSGWDAA